MEVRLSISNYRCFPDRDPAKFVLGPGCTAIVGPNNAGKSALLRLFWELRGLFETIGSVPAHLPKVVGHVLDFPSPIADPEQLFHDRSRGDLVITVSVPVDIKDEPAIDKLLIRLPHGLQQFTVEPWVQGEPLRDIHHWNDQYPCDINNQRLGNPDEVLAAVRALARTTLIGPRRAASSQATSYDFDGVTGSNLVSRWKGMKGGGKSSRSAAALVERRLAEVFGLSGLAITQSENGQDLIVSYGSQSYQIDELGSGLGHFAVALMTLHSRPSTSWALIDEPENGLHPTMQGEFLRTLSGAASEGIVFATHNYGLARSLGGRVYLVRRDESRQSTSLTTPETVESLAEFLGELGYSGYRDMGVDRLLLVEGPNDVQVVNEFRRILGLPMSAMILPLGGSDAIHKSADRQLAELKRISPRTFVLIDSERPSRGAPLDPTREAFCGTCKKLGIECHVMDRRALENYLAGHAIRSVLGPSAVDLAHFDRPSGEMKGLQVKIAGLMTPEDISETDVGKFLRRVLGTQD